jgi:hypothetical protein
MDERRENLYKRLMAIGANIAAIDRCNFNEEELLDLTKRLEEIISAQKSK